MLTFQGFATPNRAGEWLPRFTPKIASLLYLPRLPQVMNFRDPKAAFIILPFCAPTAPINSYFVVWQYHVIKDDRTLGSACPQQGWQACRRVARSPHRP